MNFRTALCGGAACPLVWGRAGAYLGRTGQAILGERDGRSELYVDDPVLPVAAYKEEEARRTVSTVLWWWVALGLRLSWTKAKFAPAVRWIGAVLTYTAPPATLAFSMPREFLDKLVEDAAPGKGPVDVAVVKRLAARVGWAGTVIHVLRPFSASLWAAASDSERRAGGGGGGVGRGKQPAAGQRAVRVARAKLEHTFSWLRALCAHAPRGLVSTVPLQPSAWREGLTMVFDASPWGGGGFVARAGVPVSWFATAWGDVDREKLGIRVADHRDQALVETFVALLGIRVWANLWSGEPTIVRVRTDSMATLGSIDRGRSTRSPAVNKVLKELAITVATSPTGLRFRLQHLPGERNQWCDALSRLAQPGAAARVPAPLLGCPRAGVEERGDGWWITDGVAEEVLEGMFGDVRTVEVDGAVPEGAV